MSYHSKIMSLNKPNPYLRISTGSIVLTRPAYCLIVSPALALIHTHIHVNLYVLQLKLIML